MGSLLAIAPAHAQGYYTGPNLTGGFGTYQDDTPPGSPYSTLNLQSGPLYGANVNGTSPSCGGQIEAQWLWTAGSPNAPVPQQVIVKQFSTASWTSPTDSSGQCDDGLKDAPVPGSHQAGGDYSSTSSGTHYSVVPADANGNLEVYCTPTASVGSGSCGVYYMASASPVFINLGGTTLVNGTQEVLTGQQIIVSLSALPSGCSASNYQWDIESANGASLCGSYIAEQAEGMTTPPYPSLQSPSVTFYDGVQDTVTVNLTVTITFPDKTTGTAKVTTMFGVVKPTLSTPTFNLVESDNFSQDPNDTSSAYGAVETYNKLQLTMPMGFTGGTGYVVQKIQSATRVDMRHTGPNYFQQQKQFGSWMPIPAPCLDGDFPYPFASIWAATPNGSQPTANQTGSGIDTPSVLCATPLISGDTGQPDWYASNGNDQFMVWIMYNPDPSSSSCIWVPVKSFTWGWSNQASLNTTSNAWSAPNFQPASDSNDPMLSGDWPTWNTWVQYSGTGYLAMRP